MRLIGVALPLVAACNAWIRPAPQPPQRRQTVEAQTAGVVSIETYCDPFGNGVMAEGRYGTGVMVSDWQVLTAAHLVECASIPVVRVTTVTGQTWRMSFQNEWTASSFVAKHDGIVRLQLSSADTLVPNIAPPTVRTTEVAYDEPLWIGTVRGPRLGFATGQNDDLVFYDAETKHGDSGSPSFDIDGNLVSIHFGSGNGHGYAMAVTKEMLP